MLFGCMNRPQVSHLSHSSTSILYSLTPPPCLLSPSEVTLALLDSANDKDPVVREQVRKSILTLGKQQPNKVLSMCQDYLVKHPKVRHHHYYCHLLLIRETGTL